TVGAYLTSRPDLGDRRSSRLVATAAEDRLSFRRNDADRCPLSPHKRRKSGHSLTAAQCQQRSLPPFAERNVMESLPDLRPRLHPCGLMLAARITLPHFSVSSAISLPNSPGDPGSATPPRSARRAFILGSARAAFASLKRQRYFSFISLKMFIFFVLGPVQTGRAPAGRGGSARVEARPPPIWDQDPRMGPALAAIATRKWEVSRSKCSSLNSPPTAADKAIGRSSTIGKSTIGEDAR